MLHDDTARNRLIGIGLVSLTYVSYTLLDGSAKWLVRSLPVLEVAWLRFAGHVLLSAAYFLPSRGRGVVSTRRPALQALAGYLSRLAGGQRTGRGRKGQVRLLRRARTGNAGQLTIFGD